MTCKCMNAERIIRELRDQRQAVEKLREEIRALGGVPAFQKDEPP